MTGLGRRPAAGHPAHDRAAGPVRGDRVARRAGVAGGAFVLTLAIRSRRFPGPGTGWSNVDRGRVNGSRGRGSLTATWLADGAEGDKVAWWSPIAKPLRRR